MQMSSWPAMVCTAEFPGKMKELLETNPNPLTSHLLRSFESAKTSTILQQQQAPSSHYG